jgi:hypothetical protein
MSLTNSHTWGFVGMMFLGCGFLLLGIVTYFDTFGDASPLMVHDDFFGIMLLGVIVTSFGIILLAMSDIIKKLEKIDEN